jgi:ketosteroid isomerase-like protein
MNKPGEQLILELELRLIEAIRKSDIPFLEEVLHDDLLFLAPDGSVVTKQSDLASHRSGGMVVKRLVPEFANVSVDGNTAVVIVDYDTSGDMLGQPIDGRFRYIRIWKQFSGGWKIIGGSCIKVS